MLSKVVKIFSLLTLVSVVNANAAAEPYLRGGLMGTKLEDSSVDSQTAGNLGNINYKTGVGATAAIGLPINTNIAFEAEYVHQQTDANNFSGTKISGTFKNNAAMGNLMVDFAPRSSISPYVGAGAGYANIGDGSYNQNVFAYQAMAGINVHASQNVTVYTGYRYFATNPLSVNYQDGVYDKTKFTYASHNVEAGLKLGF